MLDNKADALEDCTTPDGGGPSGTGKEDSPPKLLLVTRLLTVTELIPELLSLALATAILLLEELSRLIGLVTPEVEDFAILKPPCPPLPPQAVNSKITISDRYSRILKNPELTVRTSLYLFYLGLRSKNN